MTTIVQRAHSLFQRSYWAKWNNSKTLSTRFNCAVISSSNSCLTRPYMYTWMMIYLLNYKLSIFSWNIFDQFSKIKTSIKVDINVDWDLFIKLLVIILNKIKDKIKYFFYFYYCLFIMSPSRFIQHKLIFHNNIINKVFNYLSLLLEETEVIVSSTKLKFIYTIHNKILLYICY